VTATVPREGDRYDDRARSVPEMRGATRDDRPDHREPYGPKSYAAQYGITVEDAEGLVARHGTHGEIKRAVYRMFSEDEGLRRRALMLGRTPDESPTSAGEPPLAGEASDPRTPTEEDEGRAARLLTPSRGKKDLGGLVDGPP